MAAQRPFAGITRRRFRQAWSEEGATIVEFALVVLLLMTMLLGIIDFCRVTYAYHFVSEVAREATRYAAVRGYTCNDDSSCSQATPDAGPAAPGNTVVQDYVASITPPGIDSTKITTTPSWPLLANSPTICSASVSGIGGPFLNYPGCTVKVEVRYNFSFITPLVHSGGITLSSTSEMVVAH
jgi:Flp pilus assembly protein TadG